MSNFMNTVVDTIVWSCSDEAVAQRKDAGQTPHEFLAEELVRVCLFSDWIANGDDLESYGIDATVDNLIQSGLESRVMMAVDFDWESSWIATILVAYVNKIPLHEAIKLVKGTKGKGDAYVRLDKVLDLMDKERIW